MTCVAVSSIRIQHGGGTGGGDKIQAGDGEDQLTASNSTVATGGGNDLVIGTRDLIDETFSFNF